MKTVLAGVSLAALVGAAASADVTYSFTNKTWTALQFTRIYAPGSLQAGVLTGASINATLNYSTGYTYADDLCIFVGLGANPVDASTSALQCGGFTDLYADQYYSWPNGASNEPGTTSVGSVSFDEPITFNGNASDLSVWLGNGYGYEFTSGTWTGSITLIGVSQVPAPGALALLGLAGLATRRRR